LTYYGHMLILYSKLICALSMSRPPNCRNINNIPNSLFFKPRAVPLADLEEVALALDELEAIRLADLDGLYHDAAAEKMGVSRQTFGRILESAHRKVADFLIGGKALKIEGGNVSMPTQRSFKCSACGHEWKELFGTGRPAACPSCRSDQIHRSDAGNGEGCGRMRRTHARCCRRSRD
jgi:uncharacterized protein